MAVDYKISSTLAVRDDLSAVLERITALARKTNEQMAALTRNVMKSGQSFTTAAKSAEGFGSKSETAFDKVVSGSMRARGATEGMARAMSDLAGKMAVVNRAANTRTRSEHVNTMRNITVYESRGAGAPSGGRVMRDIGGSSIANQSLQLLSGGGGRVPPSQNLPQAFGQPFMPPPMRTIGGGAAGGAAGGGGSGGGGGGGSGGGSGWAANGMAGATGAYAGGMIEGFGKTIGTALLSTTADASEYRHQLELMKVAGMSAKDVAEATTAAWKTSKQVTTSTASENLKMIGELRSILPDVNLGISEAVEFLPQVARLSATMSSLNGQKPSENLAYTTMRAVEMMGGTVNPATGAQDATRANKMIGAITQAAIMSHGKLTPEEWLGFAQQASAVVKNMDPEKVIRQNAPLIMEMGGKRAGTALTSMNQQIVGGVMPQRMLEDWQKYGLINSKKVTKTRTGIRLAPDAIKGEDVFKGEGGALDWMYNVFLPTLEKAGLSKKQILDNVIRLYGRQTTQREAGIMISQKQQIQRDIAMQKLAWNNSKASQSLIANDPAAISRVYNAQKTNMRTVIGTAILPVKQSIMKSMTKLFIAITGFVTAHPNITKYVLIAAASIAAFAVIFGGILVFVGSIAAAIGAIVAIGGSSVVLVIAGIAAGIVALGVAILAINWGDVFSSIGDFFKGLIEKIVGWVNKMRSYLPSWLGGIEAVAPAKDQSAPHEIASWRASQQKLALNGPTIQNGGHELMAAAIKSALNGTAVHMDGDAVGRLVTGHQGREAGRPSTGTSGYDSRLSVLRPDYRGL